MCSVSISARPKTEAPRVLSAKNLHHIISKVVHRAAAHQSEDFQFEFWQLLTAEQLFQSSVNRQKERTVPHRVENKKMHIYLGPAILCPASNL